MYVTWLYVHVLPTLIYCYFVVNSKYIFSVMNRFEMSHKYCLSISLSISVYLSITLPMLKFASKAICSTDFWTNLALSDKTKSS